ncbi:MAG: cytidylate kinase family protein [Patescibacteria group bacterium]|nr:cytidylate kinase family protein [Patescibacteria group bacterium]
MLHPASAGSRRKKFSKQAFSNDKVMIISFNGDHGSGKSTIAKMVAEKLDYPRYYAGQIFRDMAEKNKMSLVEYLKLGEKDASIDKNVDDHIMELAKKEKDFVVESRTAWHFIPNSLKIFLKVDEEEGAQRMLKHLKKSNARSNEDKGVQTIQDVIASNRRRKESDEKRYKKYYSIDGGDAANYDFVLDTTKLGIQEVFLKTINFIDKKIKS